MTFETKQYPYVCPFHLWQALDEAQGDRNKNEELTVAVAKHVDDRADDPGVALSDEQRETVDGILNQL